MAKTLTQLIASARLYLDESTANNWSDADLTVFLNDGQRFLQSEIVEINPEYTLSRATTPTIAAQQAYATPLDLFGNEIRAMWSYEGTGERTRVVRVSSDEIMDYTDDTGQPSMFAQIKDAFIVAPIPDAAYTLELWYTVAPTDLVNGSDTIAFNDEESDLIVLWAAIRAKSNKGMDTKVLSDLFEVRMKQVYSNILGDELRTSKPSEIY